MENAFQMCVLGWGWGVGGGVACAADFLFSVRSQPGTQPIVFISKRRVYLLNKPEEFAATWGKCRNAAFRSD